MSAPGSIVLFDDGHPLVPEGALFYPVSLSIIRTHLGELVSERMQAPRYFNANIQWLLQAVVDFFGAVHHNHEEAKAVHGRYRARGEPYGVYLRSYALGGTRLYTKLDDGWYGEDMFAGSDLTGRDVVREALAGRMGCVSFVNPHAPASLQSSKAPDLPSLRVLDHNWREVVREVVKGASLVVLQIYRDSGSIDFERELVRSCGLAHRTIVALHAPAEVAAAELADFHAVLAFPERSPDALGETIRALADQPFHQTRAVTDLSGLPCYVVDKNISLAAGQFSAASLASVPYEDYLPRCLLTNWNALWEHFPGMVARWRGIETKMASGTPPETAELSSVMYTALNNFVAATTLERYSEMATSIATVGIAHRTITRQWPVMLNCYEAAAAFAGWSSDRAAADRYSSAVESLRREGAP